MRSYLKLFFASIFLINVVDVSAQTNTATPATKEVDEFAKKGQETKLTEIIPTDSLAASDLMKRAKAWVKQEASSYKKSNASSSDTKLECIASFPVKPKDLNPAVDYTGKVTMKVVIECKNSKYRYTVSDIKHISKTGATNGGSIDAVVPECGSMSMTDVVWKKLKGEMLTGASKVVADIKTAMNTIAPEGGEDW